MAIKGASLKRLRRDEPEQWAERVRRVCRLYGRDGAAKVMGVGVATVYRWLRELREADNAGAE